MGYDWTQLADAWTDGNAVVLAGEGTGMVAAPIAFMREREVAAEQLLALYQSVGWLARERLADAVENSTYVVTAWDGDTVLKYRNIRELDNVRLNAFVGIENLALE